MNYAKLHLRNHMLAATMLDRWETLGEILEALRKNYGLRATRLEAIEWMHELNREGYTLTDRMRAGSSGAKKELRLYANDSASASPSARKVKK